MFLKIVGQYHTHSSVGFALWRSEETLACEIICTRSTDTHVKITTNPNRFYPYFEGCIGALDGTHIRARVPSKYVDRFRGRKPYPTQNVLAAVDFDLRFTYVLAGWEGSAHDSAVLHDALSRPNGLKIPEEWVSKKKVPRARLLALVIITCHGVMIVPSICLSGISRSKGTSHQPSSGRHNTIYNVLMI
ncbi:uncharacterized protein LOC119333831 [Triticum dicoccoides]|uniref:uncharacterized protein LOC119333831 n=1 Tax=Triticum dicoccoides TaxID=85692 RepID=UPI00189129D2|nr:uncharacterized protein LOC119333831 [Triticum dicoccoides]